MKHYSKNYPTKLGKILMANGSKWQNEKLIIPEKLNKIPDVRKLV